ncbi:MAG: hypothetical protein IPQ07_15470 [Myxococcales bacterium]|nr:hypothetical protein [Myxococcales bacterium]
MCPKIHGLLVLALVGCQAASAGEPPPPPSARFEHDMMVRFHMHENFDLLRAIEKLLIRGKLDEATALARAISEAPDEPGLGPWSAHATRVRDLAAALSRSPSVDEACRRSARMAVACAGCHAETGVVPQLSSIPTIPPDKSTVEARMARHVWATDRLWEAVVGGGDEPWLKGLDVLSATPLPFRTGLDDRTKLAKQLQQLADGARKRKTMDTIAERGRIYGEILAACATCHTAAPVTRLPSEK